MKYGTWSMDIYGVMLCCTLAWQSYTLEGFDLNWWFITPFWVIVGIIHVYDIWKRRIAPLFKSKDGQGE